jgi:hypothetical protein
MSKHKVLAAAVVAAALSLPLVSLAQDRDQTRDQTRDQLRDTTQGNVYGWQLMSRQERAEYRARMRSLRTAQERERFRLEHHERMQERARARGITLPDEPPARGGRGMGPGGQGMGPGGGGPGGGAGGAGGR